MSSSESSSEYSSDDELIINYLSRRTKRTNIRSDHFLWAEYDFKFRYRMSKDTVRYLSNIIKPQVENRTARNNALSAAEQLLLALRFYATGSMQQVLGDIAMVHKSTVCMAVWRVSHAIASLAPHFINMPTTSQQVSSIVNKYYQISQFPKVIGTIDCTHIPIQSPGGETAELYRNRKGYFSYNVQTIVDADLNIMNVVCRWPGGSHDSTIFNNCAVKENFLRGLYEDKILLGDGGYGVESYLLTPLRNPQTPGEILYNKCHIKTRNTVERSYGVWKRRFPCIGTKLRLKQNRIEPVIMATAVLHNICLNRREEQTDPEIAIDLSMLEVPTTLNNNNMRNLVRDEFINSFFSRLA